MTPKRSSLTGRVETPPGAVQGRSRRPARSPAGCQKFVQTGSPSLPGGSRPVSVPANSSTSLHHAVAAPDEHEVGAVLPLRASPASERTGSWPPPPRTGRQIPSSSRDVTARLEQTAPVRPCPRARRTATFGSRVDASTVPLPEPHSSTTIAATTATPTRTPPAKIERMVVPRANATKIGIARATAQIRDLREPVPDPRGDEQRDPAVDGDRCSRVPP